MLINIEDNWFQGEYQTVWGKLHNKTWQQLFEQLEGLEGPDFFSFSDVYPFLTPVAFVYYLPAFLLTSLNFMRADIVGDMLIKSLTPPEDDSSWASQNFQARLHLLNLAQRKVVAVFIEFVRQNYPLIYPDDYPELRLTNFWIGYLASE